MMKSSRGLMLAGIALFLSGAPCITSAQHPLNQEEYNWIHSDAARKQKCCDHKDCKAYYPHEIKQDGENWIVEELKLPYGKEQKDVPPTNRYIACLNEGGYEMPERSVRCLFVPYTGT